MENLLDVFNLIKKDFCDLLDFKFRGNTLEIMTSVPTITSAAISVFISYENKKFAVSDGGWLSGGEYNKFEDDPEQSEVITRIISQYAAYFSIKTTQHRNGTIYYYRTTPDVKLLSAAVHDLSHFIANAVNTSYIAIKTSTEDAEQKHFFHNRLNGFFKQTYGSQNVGVNDTVKLRDDQSVKINASLRIRHNKRILQYYLMYITGQRTDQFIKDVSKAALNFKIIKDFAVEDSFYQRIAIINKNASGYDKKKSGVYLQELGAVSEQELFIDTEVNIENLLLRMPIEN